MTLSGATISSPSSADRLLVWGLRAGAVASAGILGLILCFLVLESLPALREVGLRRFFTDPTWSPSDGFYNLAPMALGTLYVSLGAILLAAPLGVLSAVFCHFHAPPAVARVYRGLMELLAGIPSVVYGLWGLTALAPWIAAIQPPGPSLLAGILVLSLMILPTIALMSDAAITNVPSSYLQGAAALGLSRARTVCSVALPAARSGIFTGTLLALCRALGETMAVLMVCGNVVRAPKGLFDPMRALTANIALEMGYAMDLHRSALFASGLALVVVVLLLVAGAEIVSRGKIYA